LKRAIVSLREGLFKKKEPSFGGSFFLNFGGFKPDEIYKFNNAIAIFSRFLMREYKE